MTALVEAIAPAGIQLEWDRIELLARCLLMSRAGKEPTRETINHLHHLQHQIEQLRGAENPWHKLPTQELPPLALDILASIYASEARPKIGLLYQDLQTNPQPYLNPALIHVLLALDDEETHAMQSLLVAQGELARRRLIEVDGHGAFATVKPDRNSLATLLDWTLERSPPPGAYRVRQQASWDDLVLPRERLQLIHEYMLWLKYRNIVVDQWGGRFGGGPVALFSGPSGTGKTFAASVIASELGWPLYRVDLARLVSKYIGETEKNIGRLFDAAHGQPMVLQFDEVDALMSKRGEIKEARDRYANMEVSYLLSRIEEHDGPCILTTNLRTQIDKAFTRRFQIVVEFPRPDTEARAQLWRRMLPPRAPLDQSVDMNFLAAAVNLTGGNIRNAALHAAYLAADAEEAIGLQHIATGVWRELAKDRVQVPRSDLGALLEFLPDAITDTENA